MNRISPVLDRLIGIEDPDELMTEITEVVSDTASAPQAGQFFLFSYSPSSTGRYDANPLVAVTDVFRWGFRGINFHWNGYRQYTWNEVAGQLYEVRSDELADVRELPFAKILLNS